MKKSKTMIMAAAVALSGAAAFAAVGAKDAEAMAISHSGVESARFVHTERDRDDGQKEYTVWLSDGTEIEFDENGSWTSIDCNTTVLPDGILPQKATDYIAQNYPQEKAYKVEKIRGGYEVGITNGLELIFDSDWNFSRLDR